MATNLYSLGTQTVVVGNNASVAGIDGTLFVDSWQTTLDLEDSTDAAVRTADLSTTELGGLVAEGVITGLAPAAIEFLWANMSGGVNATAGWEVHWDVNPNAMEQEVGQVQVADDGTVINAQASGNWSGYVAETSFSSPQSNSVSAVYGAWTVPAVTGPSTGAFPSRDLGGDRRLGRQHRGADRHPAGFRERDPLLFGVVGDVLDQRQLHLRGEIRVSTLE